MIVPVPERRRRKRILTLKNFGRLAIAMAIVFAGLTLQSEFRRGPSDGYYGRLFGKQVSSQNEIAKPKFDVVKEVPPVPDQTAADPLLIAPAAREQQYLGVDGQPVPVQANSVPMREQSETPALRGGTSGVTVVGGADGVTIVKKGDRPQPVLHGGIFRP